jgi:hypothetical protein
VGHMGLGVAVAAEGYPLCSGQFDAALFRKGTPEMLKPGRVSLLQVIKDYWNIREGHSECQRLTRKAEYSYGYVLTSLVSRTFKAGLNWKG